jgi:hypothetical protein
MARQMVQVRTKMCLAVNIYRPVDCKKHGKTVLLCGYFLILEAGGNEAQ